MYEPIRTKSVHSQMAGPTPDFPHRSREEELDIQLAGHLAALLAVTDELRGEDRFDPVPGAAGSEAHRRFVQFVVRFHLHPQVRASQSRDKTSVLLRIEGQDVGWWLRNDALEVAIEPSVYFEGGKARRTSQIVLRGQVRLDAGAKVEQHTPLTTSGADNSRYPPSIPVGTVKGTEPGSGGLTLDLLVEPYVDTQRLSFVSVLLWEGG